MRSRQQAIVSNAAFSNPLKTTVPLQPIPITRFPFCKSTAQSFSITQTTGTTQTATNAFDIQREENRQILERHMQQTNQAMMMPQKVIWE
jgi:hypothetical protein